MNPKKPANKTPHQPSIMYIYIRSRQLEGTFLGTQETGAWPNTGLRILYGWGSPPESAWPYNATSDWPPPEPPSLDKIAKKHRIRWYQRVRNITDCKLTLSVLSHPVTVTINITDEWYDAPNGKIPSPKTPVIGGHCVVLVGYDDKKQEFKFLNS